MPERRHAVDAAARALRQPLRQAPALGREFFREHARGQRGRQQYAVAGDEGAGLGETPVRGDEVWLHEAVAVEENDVAPACGKDGAIADLGGAEATILLPDMIEAAADLAAPAL